MGKYRIDYLSISGQPSETPKYRNGMIEIICGILCMPVSISDE